MIAKSAIVHPHVKLGQNVTIEDHCIVGLPVDIQKGLETIIGDNSHIRAGTIIYAGNKIGQNFQTGNKANIRELNIIGDDVSIGTHSVVEHHVVIEDDVRVHSQAFVPEYTLLKKGCWIGPNVVLTNAKYPLHPDAKKTLKGPTICEGAKVGANATILPGVNIGKGALIGAGSVVTKDVLEESVVVGNPATDLSRKQP